MEHGRLVEEENVEVVKVLYKNYIAYFKSFGMVRLLFYMLSLFVFACGCDIASNMWLVDWIDDHANLMRNLTTNYPLKYRIQVYALLGFCKGKFLWTHFFAGLFLAS
ncbi:unnamed protein product [Toxocara canis]|uniref:MFS_1_like domain-containing protein n=1 Tax=Toxocara canis TaxID=6265 RepID=A0A183U821_TOXCA|nr:unnamed protein product [Toxocara canis]